MWVAEPLSIEPKSFKAEIQPTISSGVFQIDSVSILKKSKYRENNKLDKEQNKLNILTFKIKASKFGKNLETIILQDSLDMLFIFKKA